MISESIEKKSSLSVLFWCCLGLSLAAYIVVHPILSKANLLHAVPKSGDDYLNLSFDWSHLCWTTTRPITWIAISVCSAMGSKFYFAMMSVLTVMYVASVGVLISRLLELRQVRPVALFALFFLTYCFEFVVEYYKTTGVLANLCSGNLALISMHLLLSSFRSNKPQFKFWCGIIFFLLSILTKEDFALPLVTFSFFFAFIENGSAEEKNSGRKAFALMCGSGIVFLIAQKLVAHNAFLSSQGSYAINLSLPSMLDVARQYLVMLKGTKYAIAVQISALISMFFIRSEKIRLRLVLILIIPITLLAPFLILPNHICQFYAMNWVPWQFCSALVFMQFSASPRLNVLRLALFVTLMPVVFLSTNRTRHYLLQYYRKEEVLNDNILKTLENNADALRKEKVVEVRGISDHSCPWFEQNFYLHDKLRFNCRWVVDVDENSNFSKVKTQVADDAWPRAVEVRKGTFTKSPYACLSFDTVGNGHFEKPSSADQFAEPSRNSSSSFLSHSK